MSKYVLVVAVVVGCAIAAVGALSGGQVLKGSLLAAAIGIALAVVTFAGVHIVVRNTQMLTAIMAGDYLVKVAVMVVTILVVGKFSSIDPKAAGYGLLVTILAQVMTQTWILMRAKIQTIELTKKDNQ
ncbi:MAG: hypothetical protein Q4P06_03520 [Actinomycetaceae bacterium]|nr:hypothetical protein [Actinomycetaceae bacterium]